MNKPKPPEVTDDQIIKEINNFKRNHQYGEVIVKIRHHRVEILERRPSELVRPQEMRELHAS